MISEVFQIGTSEELGTIGGFRLGRLPMTEVKVDEINAAMGHSIYLMCVLAHRFGYKFDGKYDIILCGAYCRIALKSQPSAKYELYLSANEQRYNTALLYVLDALNSLSQHVDKNYGHLLQPMLSAAEYRNVVSQQKQLQIT